MSPKTLGAAKSVNPVLWITRTAIFVALLIALQHVTRPMGQFVTGSVVNLILAVSVMTCGRMSGLTVAAVSPVMAAFLGIAPNWIIVPFIAVGNMAYVVLWHLIGNLGGGRMLAYIAALVTAAAAKFLVLYIGVARIAIPLFMTLNEQQAANMSRMFSYPQLVTALIGGALAVCIFPPLNKALAARRG